MANNEHCREVREYVIARCNARLCFDRNQRDNARYFQGVATRMYACDNRAAYPALSAARAFLDSRVDLARYGEALDLLPVYK
jgi:hypothetical protein